MDNFKKVFYKFYNKTNKLLLPLLAIAFILNIGSNNQLSLLSNFAFIFVFLVNTIYFLFEKRKTESILFGILLIAYTIVIVIL